MSRKRWCSVGALHGSLAQSRYKLVMVDAVRLRSLVIVES